MRVELKRPLLAIGNEVWRYLRKENRRYADAFSYSKHACLCIGDVHRLCLVGGIGGAGLYQLPIPMKPDVECVFILRNHTAAWLAALAGVPAAQSTKAMLWRGFTHRYVCQLSGSPSGMYSGISVCSTLSLVSPVRGE